MKSTSDSAMTPMPTNVAGRHLRVFGVVPVCRGKELLDADNDHHPRYHPNKAPYTVGPKWSARTSQPSRAAKISEKPDSIPQKKARVWLPVA
jgi:hypothetical protein